MRALAKALLFAVLSCTAVQAQTWPSGPVHLVVAYPAGGGVDFVARTIAAPLSQALGQQVVVDNRTGASGSIGAAYVARANPDGLTLLLASPAEVLVGPIAGQKVPYDPQQSLAPVALVGETPLAIAVHPSIDAKNLSELISLARQDLKMSFGTPGAGSSMHFAGESFNQLADTAMLHVPYKGAAPAVSDLLGGQIPVAIVGLPPLIAHEQAARIRILAVTTRTRSSTLPAIASVAELGSKFSNFQFSNWMGLYAPAGTPAPVVARLSELIASIVKDPAVAKALMSAGVEPRGLDAQGFDAFLRAERQRYTRIAQERVIRLQQ